MYSSMPSQLCLLWLYRLPIMQVILCGSHFVGQIVWVTLCGSHIVGHIVCISLSLSNMSKGEVVRCENCDKYCNARLPLAKISKRFLCRQASLPPCPSVYFKLSCKQSQSVGDALIDLCYVFSFKQLKNQTLEKMVMIDHRHRHRS